MDRKILERKAEFYNKQEGRRFPCSNQIVTCAIITGDRDKALSVMKEKGAIVKSQSYIYPRIEWELNNERWIWRNWNDSCKGYRLYKVIVDENIDENVFRCLISPLCANYCCSFEII